MVDLNGIYAARDVIRGKLVRTPLLFSEALSERVGRPLYFKLENLQQTGSFKPRGVLTKIARLSAAEKARGLVTISAGNHAQALAYAARAAGVRCTVVMPVGAPATKIANTQAYGATVILHPDRVTLLDRCRQEQEAHGYVYISPFDDPDIIAGQGTVGLEILEDLPEAAAIVVPIGGGGLIAGIAVAARGILPDLYILGVEPEGAPAMVRSLQAGHAVHLDQIQTIADGLAAPFAGELNYAIVRDLVDAVVLVTDEEIAAAIPPLIEWLKVVPEPAGAAALAALLTGKGTLPPGGPVVVIVSGGNLDLARLAGFLGPAPA
ncbi:MAG TPA: threonine/serine dehydratase [Chloroflexia bacterium]|nr:threonine/serine dehydratase [Chloroflexia bacterium]